MKHIALRTTESLFDTLCNRLSRHQTVTIVEDQNDKMRIEIDPQMSEAQAERLADMLLEANVFTPFMQALEKNNVNTILDVSITLGTAKPETIDLDTAQKRLKSVLPVYEDFKTYEC